MDRLDVVGMIVSPSSSHSSGIDVIGNDVAVICELSLAESAYTVLGCNLPVHQLPYLGVGTDLPISARVLGIVYAPDSHLARSSLPRDGFPTAARKRTVNWAKLISSKSHPFLQIQVVRIKLKARFCRSTDGNRHPGALRKASTI